MSLTPTQLIGGGFQDSEGNLLAGGYLEMKLSQDGTVLGVGSISSGITIKIQLDSDGNAVTSPAQYAWANSNISPVNTFYRITGYTAEGQQAWGPNNQQVAAGATFNVGTWVPNQIIQWFPPVQVPELEVNGTPNQDQSLLNLTAGDNITILDEGEGEVIITAGGLPAGTQMTFGIPGGTAPDTAWGNYTLWSVMPGGNCIFPSSSFQIRLTLCGGTGIHIENAVLVSTHPGQTTVLTSTPITFGGGQMPYGVAFSGAGVTNPYFLTSDVITAPIDQFHDWYFYVYLDADANGYNDALSIYDEPGTPNQAIIATGLYSDYAQGSHVPGIGGTVGGATATGHAPLITSILVG
jgi:hypothetical protein